MEHRTRRRGPGWLRARLGIRRCPTLTWPARVVRSLVVLAVALALASSGALVTAAAPVARLTSVSPSTTGTTTYVNGTTIGWTAGNVAVTNAPSDGSGGYDGIIRGIAGGQPGLVAVGADYTAGTAQGASWVSADGGLTWTEHLVADTGAAGFTALAASAGAFAAASSAGFWRSTDGATWTQAPGPATIGGAVMASGLGQFVALVTDGAATRAWTSVDGSRWVAAPDQAAVRSFCPSSVAASSSRVIAVGTSCSSSSTPRLLVSLDGAVWTQAAVPSGMDTGQASVSVADGRFVIIAPYHDPTHDGTAVWSSTSGTSWRRTSFLSARAASPDVIGGIIPFGSGWIGSGWAANNADDCTPIVWSSADLVHWTRAQLISPPYAGTCAQPFSMTADQGRVIAVGRAWDLVSTSPVAWIGTLATPPQPELTLSQASATGVTKSGPFTLSTKVVQRGGYVTIRIATTPAVPGADIGIWVAKKAPDGSWSPFAPHTGRLADANGVVSYVYRAYSIAWLSFQAHYHGDATHPAAVSNAIQARWVP